MERERGREGGRDVCEKGDKNLIYSLQKQLNKALLLLLCHVQVRTCLRKS